MRIDEARVNDSLQPDIQFVPLSIDPAKIRFFGTLMPALLLLKASPGEFLHHQVARHSTPRLEVPTFIASQADDAARTGEHIVFAHRWHTPDFDPLAFARARTFLAQLTRLVRRQGYAAEPLPPLAPDVNLPHLAARARLGNLSPFGLLVHPTFGPRLILSALRTDYPLSPAPSRQAEGCTDCLACLEACPQAPLETGVVELGACQRCALCLAVCPAGGPGTDR